MTLYPVISTAGKGALMQFHALLKPVHVLPIIAGIKVLSDWTVSDKIVDNMRETLQQHIEGHQQLERVRRANDSYLRVLYHTVLAG